MTFTTTAVQAVVDSLTVKGREAMEAIGSSQVSFFDSGVVEGSGSWGSILTGDLGHKSSGVINRLRSLGLFESHGEQDDQGVGDWWTLTEMGAAVANHLAGENAQETAETVEDATYDLAGVTVKTGRIWTYIFDGENNLIAEVRTDAAALVIAALQV